MAEHDLITADIVVLATIVLGVIILAPLIIDVVRDFVKKSKK